MIFNKNKKGADKLISIYWFFILVIVAGGVVMMVNSFYNSPYDVREFEAEILSTKVADCIYPGGEFNVFLISPTGVFKQEFKDNFMERCSLNFNPKGEFEEVQYYVNVKFLERGEKNSVRFEIEEGNLNWKDDCSIEAQKERLPKCVEKEFWAKGPTGRVYLVKILSIINKVEENVK